MFDKKMSNELKSKLFWNWRKLPLNVQFVTWGMWRKCHIKNPCVWRAQEVFRRKWG